MSLTTLVAPVGEPVPLAMGKAYLRVGYDGDDELISSLLMSARAHVELVTGLRLMKRTYVWDLKSWPKRSDSIEKFEFPVGPILTLNSVIHDGDDITDLFEIEKGARTFLVLKNGCLWPSIRDKVSLEFDAGFGDAAEEIPDDLRQAIMLLTAQSYERADSPKDTKIRAAALLSPWRRVTV